MDVHFHYNKQQVIGALRFHFMRRPEIKLFRGFLMGIVALAFVGYFTDFIRLKMLVWIFLLFIALMLFFWYILPFSVYQRAQTFKEPEITLRWTDEMLFIITGKGESMMRWSQFDNVMETGDFFYLYRSNKSFFLVPTNAFLNKEDRVSFSEMLQNRFPNYKSIKPG